MSTSEFTVEPLPSSQSPSESTTVQTPPLPTSETMSPLSHFEASSEMPGANNGFLNRLYSFLSPRQVKFAILGSLGVVVLAFLAFYLLRSPFSETKVEVIIEGPASLASGTLATYTVRYYNKNSISIQNTSLTFFYPQDSIPIRDNKILNNGAEVIDLGTLGSKKEGEKKFTAYIVGEQGSVKSPRALLRFSASSSVAVIQREGYLQTAITTVPAPMVIEAPQNIVSGQRVTYNLTIKNSSEEDLSGSRLKAIYPSSFRFDSATPVPGNGQDLWEINDLAVGSTVKFSINGVMGGLQGEHKNMTFILQRHVPELGPDAYVDIERVQYSSQVALPPLTAEVRVNNSEDYIAHLRDRMEYQIIISNNSKIDLRNMTLTVKLEGSMYDFGTIQSQGFFDGRTNTITWPTSALPGLANLRPGQKLNVPFLVLLKQSFSSSGQGTKDSYVKASVKVDTPDVPSDINLDKLTANGELITRISASPNFEQSVLINDSVLGGSGPFPPKVDQTTVLTIEWKAVNPANDLSPTRITAVLAPGVTWLNKTRVSGSYPQPVYNPKANTVTWDLGTLSAGTGTTLPAASAYFQISITPSINQVDTDPLLTLGAKLEGTDVITKESISRQSRDATTRDVSGNLLTRVQK